MGMIQGLVNADSIPVLQAAMQFAARRHTLIQHNIANLTTPGFRAKDVSVEGFHAALAQAADRRRQRTGGQSGELEFEGNREIEMTPGGQMVLHPETPSGNILFHDRNDRDLERSMQALAENVAAFRVATEFMRGRIDLLNSAIRERP